MNEDGLRQALRAMAGETTPRPGFADAVSSAAARRARRRRVVAGTAMAAFVLGAAGLLRVGQESTVRTVPAGPVEGVTVVAATTDGAVHVVDIGTARVVRTLVEEGASGGVARSPDGATVYYYDDVQGCGNGAIFSGPADGSAPPRQIADGARPSVSPDGTRLAYWTRQSGATGCDLSVVVRVLATGAEQRWTHGNGYFGRGPIRYLDWSPDGRSLAFGFEGLGRRGDGRIVPFGAGGVSILDTTRAGTLEEAARASEVVHRDLAFRSWRPTGPLVMLMSDVVVEQDPSSRTPSYSEKPSSLVSLVDPDTGAESSLFRVGAYVGSAEYDGTGQWLLFVDGEGRLRLRDARGTIRSLGSGYRDAAW